MPADYPRVAALNAEELAIARRHGYVADRVDPSADVLRSGLDNWDEEPVVSKDDRDWRVRMYAILFCCIYENFKWLRRPCHAVEELILEFKGPPLTLDIPGRGLGALWAGAGAWEPLSPRQLQDKVEWLRPHYLLATTLLDKWS